MGTVYRKGELENMHLNTDLTPFGYIIRNNFSVSFNSVFGNTMAQVHKTSLLVILVHVYTAL
jgi:hypothetical protein